MLAKDTPDDALAAVLAAAATGCRPVEVKRFRTGSQHYVFDRSWCAERLCGCLDEDR
jgi:hypothetical protein